MNCACVRPVSGMSVRCGMSERIAYLCERIGA